MGLKSFQFYIEDSKWERFRRAVYKEAATRQDKLSLRKKILELIDNFIEEMESRGPLFEEIETAEGKKSRKKSKK